jgi:hypothetical protein
MKVITFLLIFSLCGCASIATVKLNNPQGNEGRLFSCEDNYYNSDNNLFHKAVAFLCYGDANKGINKKIELI